jgi:hypothetical protein
MKFDQMCKEILEEQNVAKTRFQDYSLPASLKTTVADFAALTFLIKSFDDLKAGGNTSGKAGKFLDFKNLKRMIAFVSKKLTKSGVLDKVFHMLIATIVYNLERGDTHIDTTSVFKKAFGENKFDAKRVFLDLYKDKKLFKKYSHMELAKIMMDAMKGSKFSDEVILGKFFEMWKTAYNSKNTVDYVLAVFNILLHLKTFPVNPIVMFGNAGDIEFKELLADTDLIKHLYQDPAVATETMSHSLKPVMSIVYEAF